MRLSLRGEKIIVNQNPVIQTVMHTQICTIPKFSKKEYSISSGTGKNTTSQTPSSTLHLDELTRYFRHRDTIKLSKTKMDSQVIKSHQLYENLMLHHQLNLILNYNQGVALLWEKQILWSISHKHLHKPNNEDFFIQLHNTWLHFTNNNFPTPTERNSWPNLYFEIHCPNRWPVFYSIRPRNFLEKFTIIY